MKSKMIVLACSLAMMSTAVFPWGSPKPTKPVPKPVVVEAPKTPVVIPEVPSVPNKPENVETHIGEAAEYTAPVKPLPSASGLFTTNIVYQKCDAAFGKKVEEAAIYLKTINNSEEYKNAVLEFTYNKKKQFVDNEKMTNEKIYNHLIGGAEALRPTLNYQMDLVVECYYSNNSTVGYTYASANKIYANTKFHKNYSACQTASNLQHEWSHKMGFGHAVKWSSARDYSVPYGLNSIVEKLCPLAKANKLTPLKALK